jgi:Lactoylglutathione lyase and related lyases
MFARIAHVAIYTESYEKMAGFYKTIFGMKQITSGMADESGQRRSDMGHISDGTIGLALLRRNPGIRSGLDHFGFDVKDIKTVLDRMAKSFPDILVKNDLGDVVPFASVRIQDPVGVHIDVSQEGASNVREGYTEERWDQPRHFNHIALRALKPALWRNFIKKSSSSKKWNQPKTRSVFPTVKTISSSVLVIRVPTPPCRKDSTISALKLKISPKQRTTLPTSAFLLLSPRQNKSPAAGLAISPERTWKLALPGSMDRRSRWRPFTLFRIVPT